MAEELIENFEEELEEAVDSSEDFDEKVIEENDGVVELSDEELDAVADAAIDALQSILRFFNATGAEINEYEGDERELILDVVGGDLGVLIGRRGRTLDALQVIVSSIVRNKVGFHYPVTIDVESYKHRQRQKLESVAFTAASRASRQKREIKLRPMNPYERRIIHITLREDERVDTFSIGKDPDRCVIVKPV